MSGSGTLDREKWRSVFLQYAADAREIVFDGSQGVISLPENSQALFKRGNENVGSPDDFYNATIKLPQNLDTSNVKNMSWMFAYARNANPDVSHWNTAQVTTTAYTFMEARKANPDVSHWNTAQITNTESMFNTAEAANPDVSRWNVSKIVDADTMFEYAKSVNLDVSQWDFNPYDGYKRVFATQGSTTIRLKGGFLKTAVDGKTWGNGNPFIEFSAETEFMIYDNNDKPVTTVGQFRGNELSSKNNEIQRLADDAVYLIAPVDRETVAVTANRQEMFVGDAVPELTYQIDGDPQGNLRKNLTGALTVDGDIATAGDYSILRGTLNVRYNVLNKYRFEYRDGGVLSVRPLEGIQVPQVQSSYHYTGSSQSVVFNDVSSGKYEVSGQQSGVEAESYSVQVVPKHGYFWNDREPGNTEPRTVNWSIDPAEWTVTAPAKVEGLVYEGSPHSLVSAGSVSGPGETGGAQMQYAVTETAVTAAPVEGWSTEIPRGTDAGTYRVWWKVDADTNHSTRSDYVDVQAAQEAWVVQEPVAESSFVYDGAAHPLVSAGSVLGPGVVTTQMEYAVGSAEEATELQWSTTVPHIADAGTYTVYWRVPADQNHTLVEGAVTNEVSVQKAPTHASIQLAGSFAYTGEQTPVPEVKTDRAGETVEIASVEWFAKRTKTAAETTSGVVGRIRAFAADNNAEWQVLDTAPMKTGSYKVRITLADGKNYLGTTVESEFTITQAENRVLVPLEIQGWKIGDLPQAPVFAAKFGTPVFEYAPAGEDTWTTEIPATVGQWQVRARVDASDEWTALLTEAVNFVLADPASVENPANGDTGTVSSAEHLAATGQNTSLLLSLIVLISLCGFGLAVSPQTRRRKAFRGASKIH